MQRERLLKIQKEVNDMLQKYRKLTEDYEESMMIPVRDDIRGKTSEKILKQKEKQCINKKTIMALNKENNKCAKLISQTKENGETKKCASVIKTINNNGEIEQYAEVKRISINGDINKYAENNSQKTGGELNQCANIIHQTMQNGNVIQKTKTAGNQGVNGYIKWLYKMSEKLILDRSPKWRRIYKIK